MDRTTIAVTQMLDALDVPAYDLGILSDRGMLPGQASLSKAAVLAKIPFLKSHNARGAHIYVRPAGTHNLTVLDDLRQDSLDRLESDGYEPCAVVETSRGNFQAWLKHTEVYETAFSTFIAQHLAQRYQADPGAADWRRFGRLPGFTNCKPKYRQPNGLFPFVLLRGCSGKPFTLAERFRLEMTSRFQLQQEQDRVQVQRHIERQSWFSSRQRPYSNITVRQFRAASKYRDRPAAADMAFCIVALALKMPEDAIARALEEDYLSRDQNAARKAAYIRRTLAKARIRAKA